jgi:predicted alpha/beta superfamily hydrolase
METLAKTRKPSLTVCAAAFVAVMSTAAANTVVTFSVDMSNQVANASFTPGVDIVSVNGTFNGWGLPPNLTVPLLRAGGTTTYTNSVNDTNDLNDSQTQWKFVINVNTWENTADLHNRASRLPAGSGSSLVLPKVYFSDTGPMQTNLVTFRVDMNQQIQNGSFNPNSHIVSIRGSFNDWSPSALTNDPTILRTNASGVSSNVYVGTFQVVASPYAAENYRFYYYNGGDQWDLPGAVNVDDAGNRYFMNATQTLPIYDFNEGGASGAISNAPTSLGEIGRILAPVQVTFSNTALTPANQAMYMIGDLPQLGAWDPTRAVRMVSSNCPGGTPCTWQLTLALPPGVTYQYKYMLRDECPAAPTCYGDTNNGTLEAGPNHLGSTAPALPAPYTGKTVFYYSSWSNVWLIYSNNLSGRSLQPMQKLRNGRSPGEYLWRATGLNNAGDKVLYFAFTNNAGGFDGATAASGGYYETPLDAFLLQDGHVYNYWPPPSMSPSRIETFLLTSTNLASRTVRIYLPRGYNENTGKRYPVLYMHDGQNLFQGMGAYGCWNSDLNADRLTRAGKMREMIIVGVDNSPDRTTDYLPDYCGGNANKYAALLLNELKPLIDSTYRTLTDRANTATMGSSMGGIVSFYLGWEYSAYFSRIAPMSTFFPSCLAEKIRLGPPLPAKALRIYMDSGTTDPTVVNDDVGDNIEARDNLVKNGFVPNIDLLHVIGYGETHNEKWWDYRTPFAWTFLFPASEEPNTILDSVAPVRITDFRLEGQTNTVTWTSYMARNYNVQGLTNASLSGVLNWSNVFTTPAPETLPWNYRSAVVPNAYRFFRVVELGVPNWPN